MLRFIYSRLAVAALSLFVSYFSAAQCPVPTLANVNYVYPYRVYVDINLHGASFAEYEIVPEGQPFTGQPTGTLSGGYIYNLVPGTAYTWRMRGVCSSTPGPWGTAVYSFTTPPPCPQAPTFALDSTVIMNFPTSPSPNIGYNVCGDYPEESQGSYVWGFKAPVTGTYQLKVLAASGAEVGIGVSSGPHPECRGIYQVCIHYASPAGTVYEFPMQTGDSIYFGFNFAYAGTASRSVVITKKTCTVPALRDVDSISFTSARLNFTDNQAMDIEMVQEADAFSGIANYPLVNNFLNLTGLTPGTVYKWRIRGNCLPIDSSAWLDGPIFETEKSCDSIPLVSCDSMLALHFQQGKGHTYPDPHLNDDRKILFKYRPERSDILKVTANQGFPPHSFVVAVRDSALADCNTGTWDTYQGFYNTPHTVPMGYVQAGHTYYFVASHAGYDTISIQLNIHCPDLCPAPILLSTDQIQQTKATLHWQGNELSNFYEVELRLLADDFTGAPTHSGQGDLVNLSGLMALHQYHWRVRQVCTGGLAGTWSEPSEFLTMPNCNTGTQLACGDTTTVTNTPGLSYLDLCNNNGNSGPERYFRFTPPYSGVYTIDVTPSDVYAPPFSYLIKAPGGDCGVDGWTCLGSPTDPTTLSTYYLEGGQTYRLAVDRPDFSSPTDNFKTRFTIQCPPACVPPDSLYSANIDHASALAGWQKRSNDVSWELELVQQGQPFTGIPNYATSTESVLFTDLLPISYYQWRVRALCGAYGQSDWSSVATFKTTMDCGLFPPLQCDQTLDLSFPEGLGYYENMTGCGNPQSGTEVILSFAVDDNSTLRHLYFPQSANLNKISIFLKDVGAPNCPGSAGSWVCTVANPSYPVIYLNNLVQGHTYQILIKKRAVTGAFTLPVVFYCDLPCESPSGLYTQISNLNSGTVKLIWSNGPGPWHYQVQINAVNGSAQFVNPNVPSGVNAITWATLQSDSLYDWQVRRICDTGDSSDWAPGPRFRAPFNCQGAIPLVCDAVTIQDFPAGSDYDFMNACTGGSNAGQFQIYKITPALTGEHLLRISSLNGTPFSYALTAGPANCMNVSLPWGLCQDVPAPGDFSLGNLTANQTYYLQVSKSGATPGAQEFQLLCPCPPVTGAQGILYPDGSITLDWMAGVGVLNWEIELVPADSSYDGTGTFLADGTPLTLSAPPGTGNFKFRIRSFCNGTSGAWTGPINVQVYPDCPNFPLLTCDDTLTLSFVNGNGLFNHQPCGQNTPGKENYFKIQPDYTGVYSLTIISVSGSAGAQFGWLSDCDNPDSPVSCLGGWGAGTYSLGYLEAGTTYTVVADCKFTNGGSYQLALACGLPPANDGPLWLPGPNFSIAVNDSCQVFTNELATTGPDDPDPSQAPGNWYDGPEHSVWFTFTAPPGGTVQISAQSDPDDPIDPQIALLQLDSMNVPWTFTVLATGEDQMSPDSQNAVLTFTGLNPGDTYYVLVDGAFGSQGRFCLKITDEPLLSNVVGVCESYTKSTASPDAQEWINLYAGNDNPHVSGPLLAALQTQDPLGQITVSTEIQPSVPVLPSGQKIMQRYFNIETEFAPQHPVRLRLFFTPQELADFNLAPPASSIAASGLSITLFDGDNEDCDPSNNDLPSGALPTLDAGAVFVGENGLFYLETVTNGFSEFGAGLPVVVNTITPASPVEFRAFPNPFTDELEVEIRTNTPSTFRCVLTNMTAQSIWEGNLVVTSGVYRQTLPTGNLPAGVYQFCLYNPEGRPVNRVLLIKI